MNNTSGFYKAENGALLYAPTFVQGQGVLLLRDRKDEYAYPVEGWQWFDSVEEAEELYGVRAPDNEVAIAASHIRPKWSAWRREMSGLPSFKLLFQLIDQSSQGQSAWAYLLNLLFRVAQDESVIPEIVILWQQITTVADIHQETKDHWAEIAQKHDLPTAFVQAIRS